jgi:hypothetical protein
MMALFQRLHVWCLDDFWRLRFTPAPILPAQRRIRAFSDEAKIVETNESGFTECDSDLASHDITQS